MNFIVRLLSPLLFQLVRRYGLHVPGLETGRVTRSTRRLGSAVLLVLLSLVLMTVGLVLTLIDVALQYEQRGDFAWNPVLWVCLGVLGAGVVTAAVARAMMPGVRDFVPFAPRGTAKLKRASDKAKGASRPPRRPEYAH